MSFRLLSTTLAPTAWVLVSCMGSIGSHASNLTDGDGGTGSPGGSSEEGGPGGASGQAGGETSDPTGGGSEPDGSTGTPSPGGGAAGGTVGGSSTDAGASRDAGGAAAGGSADAGASRDAGGAPGGTALDSGTVRDSGSASQDAATAGSVTYSTTFDSNESPLSEGGKWRNIGLDWTLVTSGGGYAYGTQSGADGFDDSYAILSGFPPNQTASATIHLESGIAAEFAEVEILLRWSDAEHHSTGYECNLAKDGSYAEIIRWPGPPATNKNQFTFIAHGDAPDGVHDGDVFSGTVSGSTISCSLNGVTLVSATDSSIKSGNPGIGFYAEGAPATRKFSFTDFSARSLP